jgi:hypothetical protein
LNERARRHILQHLPAMFARGNGSNADDAAAIAASTDVATAFQGNGTFTMMDESGISGRARAPAAMVPACSLRDTLVFA